VVEAKKKSGGLKGLRETPRQKEEGDSVDVSNKRCEGGNTMGDEKVGRRRFGKKK